MVSHFFQIPADPSAKPSSPSPDGRRRAELFIGGDENRLVWEAYQTVGQQCRQGQPCRQGITHTINPVVFCGGSGLGKSLLARAVAELASQALGQPILVSDEVRKGDTGGAVWFATGPDWYRLYARAAADDRIEMWRGQVRRLRVLVLDDVHLLAKKYAAQRELALLLDDLSQHPLTLVATCPQTPLTVEQLDPRLASRLNGGLVVPLQLPGTAARIRIIQHLAGRQGWQVSQDAAAWFAARYAGPAPSLHQRLAGCLALAALQRGPQNDAGRPCGEVQLEDFRRWMAQWESSHRIPLPEIVRAVGGYFQVAVKPMLGSSRRQSLVQARSLAMYLAKQTSGYSLREIGRYFGGRDHSTVTHACQKISQQLASDSELQLILDDLQRRLSHPRSAHSQRAARARP